MRKRPLRRLTAEERGAPIHEVATFVCFPTAGEKERRPWMGRNGKTGRKTEEEREDDLHWTSLDNTVHR